MKQKSRLKEFVKLSIWCHEGSAPPSCFFIVRGAEWFMTFLYFFEGRVSFCIHISWDDARIALLFLSQWRFCAQSISGGWDSSSEWEFCLSPQRRDAFPTPALPWALSLTTKPRNLFFYFLSLFLSHIYSLYYLSLSLDQTIKVGFRFCSSIIFAFSQEMTYGAC